MAEFRTLIQRGASSRRSAEIAGNPKNGCTASIRGFTLDAGALAIWERVNAALRTLPDNLTLIPHIRLAQRIVAPPCLPEQRISLLIRAGVNDDGDSREEARAGIE